MKSNFTSIMLSGAAVAAMLLLAGCAKENGLNQVDKSCAELELTDVNSGEMLSKAAIDGTGFPRDGRIGLFFFKDEAGAELYGDGACSNVEYSYNQDKSKWTANPAIRVGSTPGYLYGYYPYNDANKDVKAIAVESSLDGDDAMYVAKQDPVTDQTAGNVAITMRHALARVSITVKNKGYSGAAKLSRIEFVGAKTAQSGTLNALDGSITATKSDVTLEVPETNQDITAAGTRYECLLVPSEVDAKAQNVTLRLTIDGQQKTVSLTGENAMKIVSGVKARLTIDISDTGLSVVGGIHIDDWQTVTVGGHTVTVKMDEGAPGIEENVLVTAYAKNGDVIIKSFSSNGKKLSFRRDDTGTILGIAPQDNIYDIVLSEVNEDITVTIDYFLNSNPEFTTISGHKVSVVLDADTDILKGISIDNNGKLVIEAECSSDKPVKCVKDGERIAGSKTGTHYKFTISDITDDATVTIGYSKYTATIGFTKGSVTDKATLKINGDEVEAGESTSVFEGTNVEYSAVADGGYCVFGWYDNNGQKVSDAESFTVSEINSDVAYYAEVKAGCRLTVNTISAGSSTIAANGVSIESGRAYYYDQITQITLTASPATGCQFVEWCDADGKTLSTENPYSFTLTSSLTITAVSVPQDALSGVFSVSGNKKVRFSKGNLWYGKIGDASGATFNFEANQYDVSPLTSNNETESHIGHFYWSEKAKVARSLSNYTDYGASATDVFFTNDSENQAKPNLGFSVNGQTGFWRVLSGGDNGEWKYLINKNNECGTTVRSGKYKYGVTVCGQTNCLILLPDDWKWGENGVGDKWQDGGYPETSTDKVTWQTMEKAGAVCLPAAGYRDGFNGNANVNFVGRIGYYWSASPSDDNHAYDLYFGRGDVSPSYSNTRDRAYSVRLVTESK